jgi:hypothetical protein
MGSEQLALPFMREFANPATVRFNAIAYAKQHAQPLLLLLPVPAGQVLFLPRALDDFIQFFERRNETERGHNQSCLPWLLHSLARYLCNWLSEEFGVAVGEFFSVKGFAYFEELTRP